MIISNGGSLWKPLTPRGPRERGSHCTCPETLFGAPGPTDSTQSGLVLQAEKDLVGMHLVGVWHCGERRLSGGPVLHGSGLCAPRQLFARQG